MTPKNWSFENPAWGQSAVTALVAQEFLGGSLVRLDINIAEHPELIKIRWHYFNFVNGIEIDLTKSQFGDPLVYEKIQQDGVRMVRAREDLLQNSHTLRRYEALRTEVLKLHENKMVRN